MELKLTKEQVERNRKFDAGTLDNTYYGMLEKDCLTLHAEVERLEAENAGIRAIIPRTVERLERYKRTAKHKDVYSAMIGAVKGVGDTIDKLYPEEAHNEPE